ncbi:MAG: hypothetical protein ACI9K5_002618 [Gammaproteobacteria bacterium]|jgi:hypothetical protein
MEHFFEFFFRGLLFDYLLEKPGLWFLRLYGHSGETQGFGDSMLCALVGCVLWAVLGVEVWGLLYIS